MKLLFIGGTSFVGRHTVEAAVAAAHDVTVFHRGRTNDDLLAGSISHRHGDRNADYGALDDDTVWDAVVDVCAYVPRHVHQLADALAGRCGHYVHISSISAYDEAVITPGEDSPLAADLADPTIEEVTDETYGPLKAMCERAAAQRFGEDRTSIIRPTYVAGPHDPTDRFTYWARRMARGGDVAIVSPGAPLQVVDARDLGAFIVRCADREAAGAFDGVGPWAPLEQFLTVISPDGAGGRFVEVDGAAMERAGANLPMLSLDPGPPAFMTRPGAAARDAGLDASARRDGSGDTRLGRQSGPAGVEGRSDAGAGDRSAGALTTKPGVLPAKCGSLLGTMARRGVPDAQQVQRCGTGRQRSAARVARRFGTGIDAPADDGQGDAAGCRRRTTRSTSQGRRDATDRRRCRRQQQPRRGGRLRRQGERA